MFRTVLAATMAAVVGVSSAWAVEVTETVDIAAAPDKVWGIIHDFDSLAAWHPAGKSSPADHGNQVGSVRVITLKAPGDPTITERLTAYDPAAHSYSYTILKVDPKVLPVADYNSTIRVAPSGDGAKLIWTGKFAASGTDDATAARAIAGVYRGGIENIKQIATK